MGSKDASWEKLAWESPCTGISSSTKFSTNSCSHSGISELARPESGKQRVALSPLGFLFIGFWILIGLVNIRSSRSLINRIWHSYWRDVTLNSILSFSGLNFTGDEDDAGRRCWVWLSCLESVLKVDESDPEEEFADKPGTTRGTKFSVLQGIRIPSLLRCGFWPLIHS